jgi:diaminopimelate decarboxylase
MSPALPGAPFLAYVGGELKLEGVSLSALATQHGTPLFVYSQAAIMAFVDAYRQAFKGRHALVCFAVKANPSLALLKLIGDAGCGFDIVSGGELARALASGAPPDRIVFSGIGKTPAEMRQALDAGIACFNVESLPELDVLDRVAQSRGKKARVSLRVNPDVDAHTHPYISTGLRNNKFGIAHEHALEAYRHAARLPGLEIAGIDCHIGSQITTVAPYLEAAERVLDLIGQIEQAGIPIRHIDFGGGLGINYEGETPPTPGHLYSALLERLDARGYGARELIVEPGRSLVGNAGVLLTEVLYLKEGGQKNFCIVDAAMNDLARPALYQAFHEIVPLQVAPEPNAATATYDVVGPVCESGDWLGRDRTLSVRAGDRLAVLSAGAYGMSMASNYNARPRAAEVLVAGARARVIRRRETLPDLWRLETI